MVNIFKKSVEELKGVGDKRKQALKKLSIHTIWDLLTYFPFRYEDLTVQNIEMIEDKQKVVLYGQVIAPAHVHYFGYRKSRLSFRINVDHVIVPVTFFNQPYLSNQIKNGEFIKVFGTWDSKRMQLSGIKIIGTTDNQEDEDVSPIYHSNKDITHGVIKKLVKQAWDMYHTSIPDIVPIELKDKYNLLGTNDAIYNMHFPDDPTEMDRSRNTVIFTEFLIYQLRLQYRRMQKKIDKSGTPINYDLSLLKKFFSSLPFELTNSQKKAVNAISANMKQDRQMYRLLQGDVGSGKTIVAAGAIIAAHSAGFQSAFMAPTEILAEQHFKSFIKFFSKFNLEVRLLTGSTKAKERKIILEELKQGRINLIVGTHALIQEDVIFHELGLVIIDEQHRFGVEQRKDLRNKGNRPDVLFMTATPIPRTLSIAAYGEMDVTTLDEMPLGRLPVETYWIRKKESKSLTKMIEKELKKNSQIYVVSPLIEESEELELENAVQLLENYQEKYSPTYSVALLHGRMSAIEKEQIMEDFKNHKVDILVSTTVIEVGVDISNATMMVIHDADRFGLAQLHQLRGRVGRGTKQSYCILIANPKSENGIKRMQIMTKTTDGFIISQKDLEMRGPGDYFGKKQSGIPTFKVGNLVENEAIMQTTRYEAINLLTDKYFYIEDKNDSLRFLSKIEDGQINDILD